MYTVTCYKVLNCCVVTTKSTRQMHTALRGKPECMQFVWSCGKHTRNVRNNVSRRGELWRMKKWQCQRQGVIFAHYSAWRSLSSLFIFYGMVATRGPVIYTRGMVDDTKQIRKSCNVRRLFHCGMVDDTKQIRKSYMEAL